MYGEGDLEDEGHVQKQNFVSGIVFHDLLWFDCVICMYLGL